MAELPASPSSVGGCTAPVAGVSLPCVVDNTVIEFRPRERMSEYYGEFGFDWLRVKEAPTSEPSYVNGPDSSTIGVVLAAYKDGVTNYGPVDAQTKMKGAAYDAGEYDRSAIFRPATTNRHLTYYIPYLNLYPQGVSAVPIEYVDITKTPPVNKKAPAPPFSAKLRMIRDIKNVAPEKIEIEFDPLYFKINNKNYVTVAGKQEPYKYVLDPTNYTVTNDDVNSSKRVTKVSAAGASSDDIIEITCIKEFDSDQRIKVYAYPVGSSTKTKAEQDASRKLAGQLIVCANSTPTNRKTLKMVFVQVKTNFTGVVGADKVGRFARELSNNKEIDNLYNALYQALIYPMINAKTSRGGAIILDLTKDPKFLKVGTTIGSGARAIIGTGDYVNAAGTALTDGTDISAFNKYIQDEFFKQYPAYASSYFTVFAFNEFMPSTTGGLTMGNVYATRTVDAAGHVSWRFQKSVALYKGRDQNTLNHEALHGLKLRHTHIDGSILKAEESKYAFIHAGISSARATNNVMSYNADAYTTWRWQWLIMKDNV